MVHSAAMLSRAAFCLAAAAATVAFEADAQAAPPPPVEGQVSLQYRRGPDAAGCPDEEAFRERAADEFGFRDPFMPAGTRGATHMRVEITRANDLFLATLFIVNTSAYSVSTEEDANCDALVWRLGHRVGLAVLPAPNAPAPRARAPRLRYTRGPAECLSETDFRREVAVEAGDGVDRWDADGDETVSVVFEKLPNGQFRATIEHSGSKDGSEVQTHPHCETLARHVATAVYRFVRRPEPPPPPPPAAPTQAEPEKPRPPAQQRARPLVCGILFGENCMDLTITALAMGVMTAGFTPNVGGGLALGLEGRGSMFSFGGAVRAVFPSGAVAEERVDPSQDSYPVTFDLTQVSAQFFPCVRWNMLMGCVFGEIGAVLANAGGVLTGGMLVAVGPRVGVDVPLNDRVSLFGFAEARFAPYRADFQYVSPPINAPKWPPPNTHWAEPVASAGFALGVAVHFK